MKKTIALILVAVLLCLSGCVSNSMLHLHDFCQSSDATKHFQECSCGKIKNSEEHTFAWSSDYKHKNCTTCGYIIKDNTPISIEDNEDGTIKLKEDLIAALSFYLKTFNTQLDKEASYNQLGSKLALSKNDEYTPLLVKLANKCYYVAAYYTPTHEYTYESVSFCCYDKYVWVGFENANEIKESWNGQSLVAAFQINPQDLCVNIKTGANDVTIEHFTFYKPEFVDGVALAPDIDYEKAFVYITNDDGKQIFCPHDSWYRDPSIDCIEIEGSFYVKEYRSSQRIDKDYVEYANLYTAYGEYYEELQEMFYGFYAVKDEEKTTNYTLFKIEDIVELIK